MKQRNFRTAFNRSKKFFKEGIFPYNLLSSLDYYGSVKIHEYPVLHLPNGFKIRVPKSYLSSLLCSINDVYVNREYELLDGYRPPIGGIVFDVGAYIGVCTLKYASFLRRKGMVYAIEPSPQSYNILSNNIKINNLQNVTPVNAALMSFNGVSHLYSCNGFASVNSISERHIEAGGGHASSQFTVNSITLDALINKFNVPRIDLLKIDVEGAELNVLNGALTALDRGIVDRLVIEVHQSIVNLSDVCIFLEDKSYSVKGLFVLPDRKTMLYAKLK
ncbi:MAG: FkbM family methyltransferase [Candidatus Bathyarchaeia archaeon]